MGKAFLLKIRDDAIPKNYRTIAALRMREEAIESGGFNFTAAGIFLGTETENTARGHALAGTTADYELSFEDGVKLRGTFLIMRLDYAGNCNGERSYTIAMKSVGTVALA